MIIQGFCPMGCGETLVLTTTNGHGLVMCSKSSCPRPFAVSELISDPETHHLVSIEERDYSIQHPLRERLDGILFHCSLHNDLKEELDMKLPRPQGLWRAIEHAEGGRSWDRL